MRFLRRSVLPRLRFGLLLATALLVLGLNQRTISVLRVAPATSDAPRATPPRATVIKQKVTLEATAALAHFVAPAPVAWLPTSPTSVWAPAIRRMLAVPRPRAGVRAGEVFRVRLLAVALSPQAP